MDDKKLPGIAAEDIGKCAYGIFKRGGEFIGKTVGIAGEHLYRRARWRPRSREALGEEVRYNAVSPEVYRELRLSWRRRPGQHVPVQARLQRLLPPSSGHRFARHSIRSCRRSSSGWPGTTPAFRSSNMRRSLDGFADTQSHAPATRTTPKTVNTFSGCGSVPVRATHYFLSESDIVALRPLRRPGTGERCH